jgi:nucleoside-diphosphate-sugar epimerase
MKTVALTGATSMVGVALIKECINRNIKVAALVHPDSARVNLIPKSDLVRIINCDLEQLVDFREFHKIPSIDVFYHIGWINNEKQYRNSCEKQLKNIQYTLDAVHFAQRAGCKRFIGIGGQDEYGIVFEPLNATTSINPVTPTGITKYVAGKYAKFECEKLGLQYIWARLLSVYGINDHEDRLIKTFINNCKNDTPMPLSECTQIWDYLYEDDAGRALFLFGENGIDGKIYCLGSGTGRPLKEYLEIAKNIINPLYYPEYGKIPYNEKSIRYLCADISDLSKDTGWVPEITFEEGIQKVIRAYLGTTPNS